jgi:lipopolysaccharide export LptBFGC system permease protein LptF
MRQLESRSCATFPGKKLDITRASNYALGEGFKASGQGLARVWPVKFSFGPSPRARAFRARWEVDLLKILQRYVLREVVSPTLLALGALTFVLLVRMLFTQADELTGAITLPVLTRFICYGLPTLLTLTIPMAILTGVLLGIGRMAADNEIKAFRTHGINLFPVFTPIVVGGFLASLVVLCNSLYFGPQMLTRSFLLLDQLKFDLIASMEPGRFWDMSSQGVDIVLHFDKKDPQTGALEGVYLCVEGGFDDLQGDGKKSEKGKERKQKEQEAKDPETKQRSEAGTVKAGDWRDQARHFLGDEDVEERRLDCEGMDACTVEFWMRTSASGSSITAVSLTGEDGNEAAPRVHLGMDTEGRLLFAPGANGRVLPATSAADRSINDGEWHYIAVVGASPNAWQAFLDGDRALASLQGPAVHRLDRIGIGGSPGEDRAGGSWQGDIAAVRVSSIARTETEIRDIWNRGAGKLFAEDPNTILLWTGEESPRDGRKLLVEGGKEELGTQAAPRKTLFFASSGEILCDSAKRRAVLRLANGTAHVMGGRDDPRYGIIPFKQGTLQMSPDSDDGGPLGEKRKPETMTFSEIRNEVAAYLARAKADENGNKRLHKRAYLLRAEAFQRMSISLACFAFALIGVPLAVYVRPSGKSVGITIAFLLLLVYYGIMHYGSGLTRQGAGAGPFVVFLPNVLLTILGAFMLHRTVHR